MKSQVTFDAMWATFDLPEGTQATTTLSGSRPSVVPASGLPLLSIQDELDEENPSAQLVLGPVLGKGGMGIVHSARQPRLGRDVAIKQLLPGAKPSAGAVLLREAQFMGSLEHPNIVPVHDLGTSENGSPVLVMKRIDGVAWQDLLEYPEHPSWVGLEHRSEDTLGRNISVMLDICRALGWAHGHDVVHRDLKPDNVLIGNDGEVYLGDWGVAGRAGEVSGSVVGTPAYMAPEMLERAESIDPKMDIYLLGSCLYQVLTGKLRHGGATLEEVFESVHTSPPVEFGSSVPFELAELCRKATSLDPADRLENVETFAETLRSWVRHRDADRLASAAADRHHHLSSLLSEVEPDPVAVLTTAAEVRFGYRQALEGWPEHPSARTDLVDALREMTRFSIHREDLDTARARLAEMTSLGEMAPSLHESLASVVEEVENRKRQATDLDWSIGAKQRNLVLAVFWTAGLGISAYAYGMDVDDRLTHYNLIWFATVISGAIALGIFIGRRALNRNTINRRAAIGALFWCLLLLAHRVTATTSGDPATPVRVIIEDLWLVAGTSCVLAVIVPRMAIGFALLAAIAAIIGTQWPDLAVAALAAVGTIAPLASYTLYLLLERKHTSAGRR